MAENIIVFDIEVENQAALAAIDEVVRRQTQARQQTQAQKQAVKDLEKQEKELAKAVREGNESQRAAYEAKSREVVQAKNKLKELQAAEREAAKEAKNVATAFTAQQGSLVQLRAELARMTAAYDQMADSTERTELGGSINELRNRIMGAEAATGRFQRNVGNYLSGVVTAFDQLGVGGIFTNLARQIQGVGSATGGAGAGLASFMTPATALVGVTVALAAGFAKATELSIAYKESLTNVQQITGQSAEDTKKIVESISEIELPDGQKIVTSFKDSADQIQLVLNAAPELANNAALAAEFAKNATVLAKTDPNLNVSTSVESLSKILKSAEIPLERVGDLTNALAAGAKNGDISVGQLAEGMINIGGTGKLVGLSFEQNIALLEQLSTKLGGASVASNKLREINTKLADQDLLTPQAVEQLTAAGVNITKTYDQTLPIGQRLKEFAKIQNDAGALAKVFEVSNVSAAMSLIDFAKAGDDGISGLDALTGKIVEGEKSMEAFSQAAIKVAGSPSEAIANIGNTIKNAFTTDKIADGLLSFLSVVQSTVDSLITYFGKVYEATEPLREAVGNLFAELVPLFEAVGASGADFTVLDTVLNSLIGGLEVAVTVTTALVDVLSWLVSWAKKAVIGVQELGQWLNDTGIADGLKVALRSIFPILSSMYDAVSGLSSKFNAFFAQTSKPPTVGLTPEQLAARFGVNSLEDAKKKAKEYGGEVADLAVRFGILSEAEAKAAKARGAVTDKAPATGAATGQGGNSKEVDKKAADERKKAVDDRKKANDDRIKEEEAAAKRITDLEISLIEDSEEQKRAKIQQQFEIDLAGLKGRSEQRAEQERLLRLKLQNDLDALVGPADDSLVQLRANVATINKELEQAPSGAGYTDLVARLNEATAKLKDAETLLNKAKTGGSRPVIEEVGIGEAAATNFFEQFKKGIKDAAGDNPIQLIDEAGIQQNVDFAIEGLDKLSGELPSLEAVQKGIHEREMARIKEQGELRKQAASAAIDVLKQASDALFSIESDRQKRVTDDKLATVQTEKERELALAGNNATAKEAVEKKYAEKEQQIRKEAFEKDKQLKIQQAIINGALAVTAILATAVDPTGISTLIRIAASIATTAVQIGLIESTKFRRGGVIPGPSHDNGGVQTYSKGRHTGIEVEGGEIIMPKEVAQNPFARQMAGFISSLAGGVDFSSGSLPNEQQRQIRSYFYGNPLPSPSPQLTRRYEPQQQIIVMQPQRVINQIGSVSDSSTEILEDIANNTAQIAVNTKPNKQPKRW